MQCLVHGAVVTKICSFFFFKLFSFLESELNFAGNSYVQLPCNVNVEGFPFTINNYHNNCVDVEFIVGIFNSSKNVDTINDVILLIPLSPPHDNYSNIANFSN